MMASIRLEDAWTIAMRMGRFFSTSFRRQRNPIVTGRYLAFGTVVMQQRVPVRRGCDETESEQRMRACTNDAFAEASGANPHGAPPLIMLTLMVIAFVTL